MKKEYWHGKWQQNQIGFNQEEPNPFLLQYINLLNLKRGDRIFVPLCGKSIDMFWLIKQGYYVIGVEFSLIACEAFFKENSIPFEVSKYDLFTVFQGKNITLLSGDFFNLNKSLLGTVNAVFDRAAIIALPEELRQRYAKHFIELLEPNTPLLLISLSYDQNEMEGPPFSVEKKEVEKLYQNNFSIKQLCNKPVEKIGPHLLAKGLTQASEQVYHLLYAK